MTTYTNTRGSEWRKWDLHVHTPESLEHNFQKNSNNDNVWESYIKDLESLPDEIKVLGINDYIFLDGYKKILEYKSQGRLNNIDLILPVIELRLAKFCGHKQFVRVNYHVVFSNEIDACVIEQQFINALTSKYKLDPNCGQKTWGGVITKDNLRNLGASIKSTVPEEKLSNYGTDLIEGFNNLNLEVSNIEEALNNASQYFKGKYLTAIGKTEWDAFPWGDTSIAEKKTIINSADIIFTASENIENHKKGKNKLIESGVNSLLLDCSDAHTNSWNTTTKDRIGNCNTWIKADPTFEGLKQILYEPESRVKIQETNPALDFDKSPFTEIVINKNVNVFSGEEDDGLQFSQSKIPLNDNLISIIGGRGTGKSKLVDYLANGLGKNTNSSYTRSDDIVVKRKKTLSESEYDLKLSDDNNLIFLYIRQSEIKGIVDDSTTLSKKIREIIGITEDFQIPADFLNDISNVVSNYRNTHNLLYSNGDYQEKRHQLDLEIKKYKDFITNITSEENRAKLETYKKNLEEHNKLINLKNATNKLISTLETSESDINKIINDINSEMPDGYSAVKISSISYQTTLNQINNVIKRIELDIQGKELEIRQTKDSFSDYKGDLASLLDNVQNFQNKILELETQKQEISKQEELLKNLEASLPQFGKKIQGDIELYKKKIESKWKLFIAGKENYTDKQKSLLEKILNRTKDKLDSQEQIDLMVEVLFDKDKMYKTILEGLDGRSWNEEKLEEIMAINSLESYYGYVTNSIPKEGFKKYNKWGSAINKSLDIFTRYNEFISHKIIIKSNNKPLNKLSAGQQGTTYLRLQLAANLFFTTIIYDQPEDDLDNNFITNSLVDLFKEIKKYRQVIIVSHNANLVVNSDSEQVIVAKNDGGILSYMSGALENPEINRSVCEILEGGEEAFQKREQKYNL